MSIPCNIEVVCGSLECEEISNKRTMSLRSAAESYEPKIRTIKTYDTTGYNE